MTAGSADAADAEVLVWTANGGVTRADVSERARQLARQLPRSDYIINLCETRAAFLTTLLAAGLRGSTLLLPSSRAPAQLAEIAGRYPEPVIVSDTDVPDGASTDRGAAMDPAKDFPSGWRAAIVFTSGSTGPPDGHVKAWRTLVETARLARQRFMPGTERYHIVATVPAQHMYGLETSVLFVLAANCAVSDHRPFFPRDIAEQLELLPQPRLLVTTPPHLRACLEAGVRFPPLRLIISATAPLARELAARAEATWGAPVHEIYGCTEAGSMASRHTIETDLWKAYGHSGVELRGERVFYRGAHLPEPVELQDVLEQVGDRFRLLGRTSDLVKVAGKRASLSDLTRQLLSVSGVSDGVIFVPRPDARCAALVVANGVSRETILAELAQRIDPVFLPRPLVLVPALPRNETGKLPRAALLAAIGSQDE
jgi:acyl-coenzyme A synthetase/AMP-(fatty) acid ligase